MWCTVLLIWWPSWWSSWIRDRDFGLTWLHVLTGFFQARRFRFKNGMLISMPAIDEHMSLVCFSVLKKKFFCLFYVVMTSFPQRVYWNLQHMESFAFGISKSITRTLFFDNGKSLWYIKLWFRWYFTFFQTGSDAILRSQKHRIYHFLFYLYFKKYDS